MASIPSILNAIRQAVINSISRVRWQGTYGLETITTDITNAVKTRGIMVVDDITQLSLLGGGDTYLALVLNQGLYRFNPNIPSPVPDTTIIANGGGVWELLTRLTPQAFSAVIGNNTLTEFTLTHNFNTVFPEVEIWNTGGGLPYAPGSGFTIQVINANSVKVVHSPAIGLNSHTVIIRK